MKSVKKVKALTPGSTIGIIAPGAPADPERFSKGLRELHDRGFKTKCLFDPCDAYEHHSFGFFSASLEDRREAFMALVEDDEVAAVIAARGGYGAIQLLPSLDYRKIQKASKLIVGFSDVTALLVAITTNAGIPTIHGPMVASQLADAAHSAEAQASLDCLMSMMSNAEQEFSFSGEVLRDGQAEGPIIGGNLTTLLSILGTPWDTSYDGCVLMLEDVGEAPYRIHRALTQLKLAGKLDALNGLIFGCFESAGEEKGLSVEDVLRGSVDDILENTTYPVLLSSDFGHGERNFSLPLGCRAKLEGTQLVVLDSPVVSG